MMKKRLLFIFLILALVVCAAACSAEIVYKDAYVTEINVTDLFDNNKNYVAGDEINLGNGKLIVTYSDLRTETIDLTVDMLSGYDMNTPEEGKVVTVTYGGQTTTFKINVYDLEFSSVELASYPNQLSYVVGENVMTEGAYLDVNYEGGKTVKVKVTNKMLEDYDNQRVGDQEIYISYYGYKLSFAVNFADKTVIDVSVLHNPNQNSVFLNYGDRLDLDGMRLRFSYDNGLAPAYDVDEIIDNVKVFIDDSQVGTVLAKVAYVSDTYPETVVYPFTGTAMVRTGDYVYPNMELASNALIENVTSKTYGKVISIDGDSITVSTVVEYDVTEYEVEVGEVILQDDEVGKSGGQYIYSGAGGGLVTEVGNGKVILQTLPVTSFNINVKDRSYASMEIDRFPVTNKHGDSVNDIIQGDTLNLSSGRVKVFFDNGEAEFYNMDDANIKVINSADDMLLDQIEDFSFTSVDDVKNLPAGRYELKYGTSHGYGDRVSVVVTVVDETGRSIYVQENRFVSLDEGLNYTVSITATYNNKKSECVYYLSTVGAGVRQNRLDITAAGQHKLLIVYGGVQTNSIPMIVTVIQRYEKELNIVPATNNISGQVFRKGDVINVSSMQYTITYNNGDVSEPTGITMDMLGETCTLECNEVTERKEVFFRIPDTDVVSATMICRVIPMPIKSVTFAEEPIDVFLRSRGDDSNHIDLSGGIMSVYYDNGKVVTIGASGKLLPELLANSSGTGERITIEYNEADTDFIPLEQILAGTKHYEAMVTYFDADGASASVILPYYIINNADAVNSIKIVLSNNNYKKDYVQCDDWDLTGISMTVTKQGGATLPMAVTKDMIYDSTTDVVGKNIQVKFKYLGKVDNTSLKINVEPRMETGLTVIKTGTNLYKNTQTRPDLTGYKFSLSYNAGASAEVTGLDKFSGAINKAGWWYEIYEETGSFLTEFQRVGKKIIRLYHTVEVDNDGSVGYAHVSVDLPIEVVENTNEIKYIAYEDVSLGTDSLYNPETKQFEQLPILEITAAGWELFLNNYDETTGLVTDKYLSVYYDDGEGGEEKGFVKVTTDLVIDYHKNDISAGARRVKIQYKTYVTYVSVRVVKAEFVSIAVEKKPITNFIAGSELTKDGGIVKCVFEHVEGDGAITYLYKYLDMGDESVLCTGFNSNISEDVDHVQQDVTLQFREKTTTYKVTIYNKQTTEFKYQNTIFFYGNTKSATATPLQFIPEFDLPDSTDIFMWYVSSQYFIEGDAFEQYLIDNPDVTRGQFISFLCEDGLVRYVSREYLQADHPVEPLKKEYTRYIIMEVLGNTFYKKENYCLQEYTVIPKVIEVTVIDSNSAAYTLDYEVQEVQGENNLADSIMYLYQDLDTIVDKYKGGAILSVELLSPNTKFFRIGVTVTGAFNEATDMDTVKDIFTEIKTAVGMHINSASSVTADLNKIRKGINIGEYNGLYPEYVSYRIAAGETLTLNGVLELLEGNPALAEYDYGTGTYRVVVGELCHAEDHYTIDFVSGNYVVNQREITNFTCTGSWNKDTKTLTMSLDALTSEGISAYVTHADGNRRIAEEEFFYYSDIGCTTLLDGKPTTAGDYYVKVGADGSFNEIIQFKLIIE